MVILTLCHAAFRFRDGDTYVISSARETTWARWDPKALKVGKPEVQVRQAASQCPEAAGFKVDRLHDGPKEKSRIQQLTHTEYSSIPLEQYCN